MTFLGKINIITYLKKCNGEVTGQLVSDGKIRRYYAKYKWQIEPKEIIIISKTNGTGDNVKIRSEIPLDESMVSFFGLYSGDGAKGSEDKKNIGLIKTAISFSQREPNLVRFAVEEFRKLFKGDIRFNFSLGEDSAFFMDGDGLTLLKEYYGGIIPNTPLLNEIRPQLNNADNRYLSESRKVPGTNEENLSYYYFHKDSMKEILIKRKLNEILESGLKLTENDKVTASLRRPYKKGAREPGGSSRSDEIYIGGVNGFGDFFLKIMQEIEQSIHDDCRESSQGLIEWNDQPSKLGNQIDVIDFFTHHNYGSIAGERPSFSREGIYHIGKWPRSKEIKINPTLLLDPLWCYVSGLYLAEGSTSKALMFSMYREKPQGLALGFTSSEDESIALLLRALQSLFPTSDCLDAWKIKVGSQYFPELVVIGLKNGVPMLRGGNSGDGKMRTMEISLALKDWALEMAPALIPYADKYSHVEPTGAGVARIDMWGSSSLARWFFPLIMYATFGEIIDDPVEGYRCSITFFYQM